MAADKTIITTAKNYYVEQKKDIDEIAVLLNKPRRTISSWAEKGKWKAERDARINGHLQRIENIRQVISNLTEQALDMHEQRKEAVMYQDKKAILELDMMAVGIADQISKWNKALENIDKKGKVTLEVYLHVMDEIFKNMQGFDKKLFLATIEFQQQEVERVSNLLG